jgi:hypothetical protein
MKVLLIALCFLFSFPTVAQQNVNNDKFHEFDFWLGEWDVYNKGDDTIRAESYIQTVIDSFAIQENYAVLGSPYKGKSFNKYNPQLDRWEQFWVDNGGLSLFLTGGLDEKGSMVLGSEGVNSKGQKTWNQISWTLLDDGSVNQIWLAKTADGDWLTLFDGIYKKKGG